MKKLIAITMLLNCLVIQCLIASEYARRAYNACFPAADRFKSYLPSSESFQGISEKSGHPARSGGLMG